MKAVYVTHILVRKPLLKKHSYQICDPRFNTPKRKKATLRYHTQYYTADLKYGGYALAGVQIQRFGAMHGNASSEAQTAADVDAHNGVYRAALYISDMTVQLVASGELQRVQVGSDDDITRLDERGSHATFSQAKITAAFLGNGGNQIGAVSQLQRDFADYGTVLDDSDLAAELVACAGFHY